MFRIVMVGILAGAVHCTLYNVSTNKGKRIAARNLYVQENP